MVTSFQKERTWTKNRVNQLFESTNLQTNKIEYYIKHIFLQLSCNFTLLTIVLAVNCTQTMKHYPKYPVIQCSECLSYFCTVTGCPCSCILAHQIFSKDLSLHFRIKIHFQDSKLQGEDLFII